MHLTWVLTKPVAESAPGTRGPKARRRAQAKKNPLTRSGFSGKGG